MKSETVSEAAHAPSLFVHRQVVERLGALPAGPCEVGGWLLGYWTADERNVIVTHATPAGRRGTPFHVRISGRGHRKHFDEAWAASEGHVTFLGDWHSHPGGSLLPSTRDRRALAKLAQQSDYGTPRPLLAIARTPRWPWRRVGGRALAFFLRTNDHTVLPLESDVVEELPPSAARVPAWSW